MSGAKNTLSNTVEVFLKSNPDATDNQRTALANLQTQYSALNKQYKDQQAQCKKLSRQIGEAKREGVSTDELMQSMQEQSSDLGNIKTQLTTITEKVTALIKAEVNDGHTTSQTASESVPTRTYTETSTDLSQISVTLLNGENDAWNDYVNATPDTSLYHRSEWKDLIQKVFGHSSYYFYACNSDKEIVGILPIVRLNSKLFGDFMVSMPYFNYGGAIANSLLIEQILLEEANDLAKKLGVNHIEYRDNIERKGLEARTEKVNMILSLPNSHDVLWDSFSSKLRSQIKRPMREATESVIGNTECLDDFYAVFARNMRDLGTPVYGKDFFKNILETFPQNSKIVIIRLKNKPVAAAFLLGDNNMLEIPWASTIKDVNHLSINMLLYWEVLKFAIDKQYRTFDFGRSSKDAGTYRFKQQWGAKAKQMYWHYWLPDGAKLPELNPSNPKYALMIGVWKRLPIWVTKWLGPYIVKNLP